MIQELMNNDNTMGEDNKVNNRTFMQAQKTFGLYKIFWIYQRNIK